MTKLRNIIVLSLLFSCIFAQIISSSVSSDSLGSGGLASGLLGSVLSQPLNLVGGLTSGGLTGSTSTQSSNNLQVNIPASVSVGISTGESNGFPVVGDVLNVAQPLLSGVVSSVTPLVGGALNTVSEATQNTADPALNQGPAAVVNKVLDPVTELVSNLPIVGSTLQVGSPLDPVTGLISNLPLVGQNINQVPTNYQPTNIQPTQIGGSVVNSLPIDQVVGSTLGTVSQTLGSAVGTIGQLAGSVAGTATQTVGSVASQPLNGVSGDPSLSGGLPLGNIVGQVTNTATGVLGSIPIIGSPSTNLPLPSIGLGDLFKTQSSLLGPVTNLLGVTTSAPGFYIDSISKQIISKQYQLQGDYIEINFDFRLLSTLAPKALLIVYLNNQPIFKVLASDSGKTIKIPVASRLAKGLHTIGFLAQGATTDPAFTCHLANLVIFEKQIFPQWTSDLIINGGFSSNTCANSFCIWNNQNFAANFIAGWIPTPEIKIVRSLVANPNFGDTWVLELDASSNTCIRQLLNLKTGRHNLKFDWAARANSLLSSNGLLVYINGNLLKSIAPADYSIHTESLDFILNASQGST